MNVFEKDVTFRGLTAPGYFNFSDSQTADTKKYIAWFDSITAIIKAQVLRFDAFFRLWMTYNYTTCTISRTPFVAYLLNIYGIQWFLGTDIQAVALIGLVARSYGTSLTLNYQYFFSALTAAPFLWINGTPQIVAGYKDPAIFAENLVIYSTSGTLPATPAIMPYGSRAWAAPAGWTKQPSSATYVSHGYLSGANIVWMTPRATSAAYLYTEIANTSSFPPTPSIGDKAIVASDTSGDYGSIYYYDGAVWRKITTPNSYQGLASDFSQDVRAVMAPVTSAEISSAIAPPVSGPSQGYGKYAGLYQSTLYSNSINIVMDLTTAGNNNLGVIIYLLRKLKPSLRALYFNYSVNGGTVNKIQILDSGALQ